MKQVSELNNRLEQAENNGKGLKNQIRRLEQRIMELENDLDSEARNSTETVKGARQC